MPNHLVTFWQSIDGWIRWACLGLAAPILAIGLLYWGYCWHWWGRDSLVLQYLFQCRCPSASEATRYPNLTVLVSACESPFRRAIAPSGRFLFVEAHEGGDRFRQINLQTHEVQAIPLDRSLNYRIRYIDDERLFIYRVGSGEYRVLDMQDGIFTSISWVYADTQDPHIYDLLHNAQEVLVFDQEAIALAENYKQHNDDNIILRHTSPSGQEGLSDRLTTADIPHQVVTPPYQTGAIRNARYSPDGRFYALRDGIYDATTDERLIRTELPVHDYPGDYAPLGWVAGQRGVVYTAATAYVIDNSNDFSLPFAWFPVPQPVLLLELPEEFWTELEEEP